jgi:hypothetical protein
MTDELPTPAGAPSSEAQKKGDVTPQISSGQSATVVSSRRQAFRDIRRQLSDDDLASPGVQKLLLDDLEQAEEQCEIFSAYIERFHEADKRAAILEERVRTQTALEVAFGVGVGLGCAILGLAPLFWTDQPKGWLAIGIGALLTIGASIARVVKR